MSLPLALSILNLVFVGLRVSLNVCILMGFLKVMDCNSGTETLSPRQILHLDHMCDITVDLVE